MQRNTITYDTAIIACEKGWRHQHALELVERRICESEKGGIVKHVLEACIENLRRFCILHSSLQTSYSVSFINTRKDLISSLSR